ncbi:hypothetical protein ACFLYJ_01270 [Candidatus Cloacimonadota bacterium]
MKSKLTFLFSALILLIFVFGCSEKDTTGNDDNPASPPELAEVPELTFAFPDSADLVNFVSEDVVFEGETVIGYNLVQFLDFDRVGVPELEYTYEIVSDDGYTPRIGGNADLAWSDFETGYLLPTEKFRTFFPSDDIFTAYDVKWAIHVNLYRTMIVVDEDGNEISFQPGAYETEDVYHQAGNGNFYTDPGFKLERFVSDYITDDQDEYEYHFTASDDNTVTFTWEDIEEAWWLTTQNKAVFLNEDGTEFLSSFKYLVRIELIELP